MIPSDRLARESFAQMDADTFLVSGGIGDILQLLSKLMAMNIIPDAIKLLDMWQNDARYTVADLKNQVRIALGKLGVIADGRPVPPRLEIHDELDTRVGAVRLPTYQEAIQHLRAKGMDTDSAAPSMVYALTCIAIKNGLGLIERLLELIVERQSAHERLTWLDLLHD